MNRVNDKKNSCEEFIITQTLMCQDILKKFGEMPITLYFDEETYLKYDIDVIKSYFAENGFYVSSIYKAMNSTSYYFNVVVSRSMFLK